MLLEINSRKWDSRIPDQSQVQSAGWDWKERSNSQSWLPPDSDLLFVYLLAVLEGAGWAFPSSDSTVRTQAKKVHSCCDRRKNLEKQDIIPSHPHPKGLCVRLVRLCWQSPKAWGYLGDARQRYLSPCCLSHIRRCLRTIGFYKAVS